MAAVNAAGRYSEVSSRLGRDRYTWMVTGAAGFIGSNLLEALLKRGQRVVALDDFSTGYQRNLDQVKEAVGAATWSQARFIEGDIRDAGVCREACRDVDFVLHEAALGSVPRSIDDPVRTHTANVDGFVNMLVAARDAKVKRFVYAASSSAYGDSAELPKVEERIGRQLSPYAVTKYVNELYADVFATCYGMGSVGLRYFNVFGPRQDPDGAYAAVIPLWIASLLRGEPVYINGDGETSRDFCFVENVIQANLLAALGDEVPSRHEVFNVAVGARTTLNDLFAALRDLLGARIPSIASAKPVYRDFRAGDVRHSLASIDKISKLLGYVPTHTLREGLEQALPWYIAFAQSR